MDIEQLAVPCILINLLDMPDGLAHAEEKGTLASRRSRPELDLTHSFPKPCLCRHTPLQQHMEGSTPIKTPSLDESLETSPLDRTPSPVRSLGGLNQDPRYSDEEEGGPLSRVISPIARVGKRPSFSRSRSDVPDKQSHEPFWAAPTHPRTAVIASQLAQQRRASEGNPMFFRSEPASSYKDRSSAASTSAASSQTFSSLEMGGLSGRTRQPTVSSTWASSGPLTPSDEEAINAGVRFSWGPLSTAHDARRLSEAMGSFDLGSGDHSHRGKKPATSMEAVEDKSHRGGAGLMGTGHFGPGVRAKVSQVLDNLIDTVPLDGDEDEVVAMCEYGALNSRSATVMTEAISRLAKRHYAMLGDASNASFYVTHADSPLSDFRPISGDLDLGDSYTSSTWQATHQPPLTDRAFSAFAGRSRHLQVLPAKSVSVGISLFDLHWAKNAQGSHSADQELQSFLKARGAEFRAGGLLVMAFIQRSDESAANRPLSLGSGDELRMSRAPSMDQAANMLLNAPEDLTPEAVVAPIESMARRRSSSSPVRPQISTVPRAKRDLWSSLTRALAPCIQRLVSCGMIKSDVARHLLALPAGFQPRSPSQTAAVLQSQAEQWSIEYSAGLEEALSTMTPPTPRAPASSAGQQQPTTVTSEEALMLCHPACKALQAGLMGPKVYAEHGIQLVKTLYESHFRQCLAKRGKLSRSATEWVVDSLMDILREKIEEEGALQQLELEVTIVALRRK